ncbi:hypothetical protein AALO_G00173990 [Alosa alosa]|uniref:Ig-like domain-containing protein n=1 Tax=Alosa alosa TaxID=278164 RepID=A0AAV6G784_9TELE|nr:carcinoembryonic antigen-related cell adhesion molecule 1-like [Alosa alosa]KAG5270934.1 hypothetical protein AALO_G00173990 [Alosa alosa]
MLYMDYLLYKTTAFLVLGLCSCQDELLLDGPLNRTVGENVVFTLINPPSTPPSRISWISPSNREIITTLDDAEKIHPDYTGRISLNKTTASLELSNLTLNDTGEYTLGISMNSVPQQANTSLTVFGKISTSPIISTWGTLMAGKSSVNLTCDAQGTIVTREWTKDGKPLSPSNRTTFYEKNRILSISPVEKEDNGQYTCTVSNPFSVDSKNYTLAFNPETPSSGLSDGEIAGIVIGTIAGVALVVCLIAFGTKKAGVW